MPTLTLMFRNHRVSIHRLDRPRLLIGRNPACDIPIDSLAVAPEHAEVVTTDNGCRVRCLDPDFPIFIDNSPVSEAPLKDGDVFRIGKHQIGFSDESTEFLPPNPAEPAKTQAFPEHTRFWSPEPSGPPHAFLQILNGPRIGQLLVIEQPVNRLTHGEHGEVTLTREGERYLLTARDTPSAILVDGQPLGEGPLELRDGQEIQIGPLRVLFLNR